ncbi:hypothetical protein Cni_G19807 [Canna indica]|uniref:Uncharacterized protein n=1 Tax=Canna indica TaxID=4628 RepID=A0AAQ3QFL3_9LILI|nr:hypothetical protein Cni_G19807 [Canna indica]
MVTAALRRITLPLARSRSALFLQPLSCPCSSAASHAVAIPSTGSKKIGFLALMLHIGMLVLFVYIYGWGLAGLAMAFDISAWIVSLAQVAYIMGWCRDGWTGFSWMTFKDIWVFVRLSLVSAVMLCLEIWYLSILIVLTVHLENVEIAVGCISICVRVSNELGAGRPRATKYVVMVVFIQSLAIGLLFMAIILATRNSFIIIFTSDKNMQQAVARIAYLLSITMVLNSIQPVISGATMCCICEVYLKTEKLKMPINENEQKCCVSLWTKNVKFVFSNLDL